MLGRSAGAKRDVADDRTERSGETGLEGLRLGRSVCTGPRAALHVETPHLRSKRGRRADRGALQEARGAERSPIAEARVAARRGSCAPRSNQRATRSSCHPPMPIERSRRGRFEPSTPTHQPHIDESEARRLRSQRSHWGREATIDIAHGGGDSSTVMEFPNRRGRPGLQSPECPLLLQARSGAIAVRDAKTEHND